MYLDKDSNIYIYMYIILHILTVCKTVEIFGKSNKYVINIIAYCRQ